MEIQVVGFDADDTLWVNETYYRETEREFYQLIKEQVPIGKAEKALFETEIRNLPLYGYGAKGFMLSMIETAETLTDNHLPAHVVLQIIDLGRALLNKPLVLLADVKPVLKRLKGAYRLIVVTKGDLLDQERKLKKSGLTDFFHHIEIMSDKQTEDYEKLLNHLGIAPKNFLMIGNSLKSDILPVIKLGAYGIHVPCKTTWQHEIAENTEIHNPRFLGTHPLKSVPELIGEVVGLYP